MTHRFAQSIISPCLRVLGPAMAFGLPGLVMWLLNAVWHSGDDAFVAYTLSGQLGFAPDAWWDFRLDWHFLLGAPLAALYQLFPAIHWYFLFLYLLTGLGQLALLRALTQKFSSPQAWLFYALLTFSHSLHIWANPSYSVVAFSTAACLGFAWRQGVRPWWLCLGFGVCLLLRFQMAIPGFALAVGLSFLPQLKKQWQPVAGLVLMVLAAWTLFLWHQQMGRSRGFVFQQVNEQREAYFSQINVGSRPFVAADTGWLPLHLQQQFSHAFFVDSFWQNLQNFEMVGERLRQTKQQFPQPTYSAGYFLIGEYRRWLPTLLLWLLCLGLQPFKIRWLLVVNAALPMALAFLLLHWAKLPQGLWTGLLFTISLSCIGALFTPHHPTKMPNWRWLPGLGILLIAVVNGVEQNSINQRRNAVFQSAYAALPPGPVVATTNFFPVDEIAVWQHPAMFPLFHFFSPFQAPTQQHESVLKGRTLRSYLVSQPALALVGPPLTFSPQDSVELKRSETTEKSPYPQWTLVSRKMQGRP